MQGKVGSISSSSSSSSRKQARTQESKRSKGRGSWPVRVQTVNTVEQWNKAGPSVMRPRTGKEAADRQTRNERQEKKNE